MAKLTDAIAARVGREGERLLGVTQLALLGNVIALAIIAAVGHPSAMPMVLVIGSALLAVTALGATVPWSSVDSRWGLVIPAIDFVLIGLLNDTLFGYQRGIALLAVIPVLWLSYRFGPRVIALSIIGDIFVGLFPYLHSGLWPATPGEWGSAFLPPATIAVVAIAVNTAARHGAAQRNALVAANEQLRVAIASGLVGDEALRVSVASGLVGDEALRVSVASGVVGDEALRVSVAEGLLGDEALRVSVAEGVVGAEKLRVSVAEGLIGIEALRVSEARGDDGDEALRIALANGLDAASAALAVVDTVDAGITFYDPDGVVLLTNDTARALDVSGKFHGAPLVFEDDRITPIPVIDQILARASRGELVTRRAYWVGEGDEQRAMMATSQYVRRASGDFLGTVVATHDVTPLADAIRQRDQFLETVSHELRTPLTSMIGYLEVIEDSIDLEQNGIADEFAVIQRNTDRLLKLITDLLLTEENQAMLERRSFNIADLAANALNAIRPAAAIVGVRIVTPTLMPVLAEVDAERISDVLDKLLSNALKFNQPGGEVSLTVERIVDEVVIRISDTGIGMTDADQIHIFERFFRSSNSRSGVIAGAGLGLSSAKIIVDAHNGSITAESRLGSGTTMELRLPLLVG